MTISSQATKVCEQFCSQQAPGGPNAKGHKGLCPRAHDVEGKREGHVCLRTLGGFPGWAQRRCPCAHALRAFPFRRVHFHPGKKNGESRLRSFLLGSPYWNDAEARETLVRRWHPTGGIPRSLSRTQQDQVVHTYLFRSIVRVRCGAGERMRGGGHERPGARTAD